MVLLKWLYYENPKKGIIKREKYFCCFWRAILLTQRAFDFVSAHECESSFVPMTFILDNHFWNLTWTIVACLTSADKERSILLGAMQLGNIFNYVFHHSSHLYAPTSAGMT